ncbi:MAG TPA: PucR family transcriptional regulator [Nakamurella sp.]|nr:PucR family transcriptional regulator [Nakamurella sp.]
MTPSHTAAPLTVADLLELPVLQRGRPEVLAGTDLERREVRWVHTSEIYEISPLLKGGEVLLTTGLGLVGASPAALRSYAAGLAERSVAALVLELGRTFTSPPADLVSAAQDAGMPLIALRGIVPFVEVTEAVHALLLSGEVARLRLGERIAAALTVPLLAGSGLTAILRVLAELAGCPVRLFAGDGHLVAASDGRRPAGPVAGDRVPTASRDHTETGSTGAVGVEAPIDVFGRPWGRLVIGGPPNEVRTLVAERGAIAVALELGRAGVTAAGPGRQRAGSRLLRDIFGRQYSSADELVGRAAALGVVLRAGQHAVGLCLAVDGGPPSTAQVVSAVSSAADRVFGAALVTELDGSYLVAGCAVSDDPRALGEQVAQAVDAELPAGRVVAVTCGPPVTDIPSLARSLRAAREASVLARRLGSGLRTLLASDLGVHRLLGRFAADPELAAFVDEQLGPLLDHDAARGRELVRTLDTLLACGLSKAATARSLGIRRQTLYQRLATISALLGGLDLSSRERRTAIDLALVGWRLRTAAVPATGG